MPCTYPLGGSVGGTETARPKTNIYVGRPSSIRQLLYADVKVVE